MRLNMLSWKRWICKLYIYVYDYGYNLYPIQMYIIEVMAHISCLIKSMFSCFISYESGRTMPWVAKASLRVHPYW